MTRGGQHSEEHVTDLLALGERLIKTSKEIQALRIDESNPELYLFSGDYAHIERGRNPIARFETAPGDRSEKVRDRFCSENFLRIFPDARISWRVASNQYATPARRAR
ncbi:MAG: hypothetical protein ACREQR_12325 [Candidatus Binataceae bacterium]